MTLRPFPKLPYEVTKRMPPSLQHAEVLGGQPDTWDSIPIEDFKELLEHHIILMGLSRDQRRVGPLQDLYAVALRRLSSEDRLAILLKISAFCESECRRGQFVNDAFFVPFLLDDDSADVVSTAALQAATWLGSDPSDPLVGRRAAIEIAAVPADHKRRGMILGGIVALGDSLTMSLVSPVWQSLSRAGQDQVLKLIYALPFAGVAEFMLARAEEAVLLGREDEMAAVFGALISFAWMRRDRGKTLYAGWPVRQIRRNLPAWAYETDQVVIVERTWTFDEFAQHVESRLRAIAACEREEPQLAQKVLREWGLENGTFQS